MLLVAFLLLLVASTHGRWVALRKLRCEPHVCDTHTRQQSWSEVQVECSGGRRTHIDRWATLAAYTHDHDGSWWRGEVP